MEQTLQALGAILLKAIPTVVLVLILNFYFKRMLFGPLDKVLERRDELTEGARHAASESLKNAEAKAAQFEKALADARAEIYREQERSRRRWLEDQAAEVAAARDAAEKSIAAAKIEIGGEADAARRNLQEASGALAEQIASSVLVRRAG